MRITFNTVNRHTQYVISNRYGDLTKLQKKLATGKELMRPSDGPVDVANVLNLKTQGRQLEQYNKNMDDGRAWMEITDTTMVSMNNVIQRARELAIQGDSDTLSVQQRKYLAEETEQLTRQTMALINTKYKGDYIFSGSQVKLPPLPMMRSEGDSNQNYTELKMSYFDGSGAAIGSTIQIMSTEESDNLTDHLPMKNMIPGTLELQGAGGLGVLEEGTDYSIDYKNGKITLLTAAAVTELAKDFTPHATINPGGSNYDPSQLVMNFEYAGESRDLYGDKINTNSDIFREIESGVSVAINTSYYDLHADPNTDIVSSLIQLGSALINNSQTDIRSSIDNLDISFDQILSAQSVNGAKINLVETTTDRNTTQQINVEENRASLEDADYADVVTDYSVAQTVFNAALQSTAQIMQTSLADFIR